jgi:polysaccharide export outer membrane protein
LAGLTLHAAESLIDDTFQSHEILIHPQVTLDIVQYAPFLVDVTGEVQKPGNIELQAPRSLLAILAEAGGLTDTAGSVVQITHNADGVRRTDSYPYSKGSNGDSIHDVLVYSGDTIVVPRAGIVYVLGAVGRPGGYVMQEHGKLDVAQALALALGTLPTAAVQSTRVIRRNPDGSILDFSIDYKAISEGKQVPVSLQAEDIVYVPVSKVKTFFTSSAGIIGTAATTTVYAVK